MVEINLCGHYLLHTYLDFFNLAKSVKMTHSMIGLGVCYEQYLF